ncbi:hypothetical protein TZ02_13695 [Clostridium aceticum]|nr:hypothetical protein TZ02_13695 [Clostridium aceticum]
MGPLPSELPPFDLTTINESVILSTAKNLKILRWLSASGGQKQYSHNNDTPRIKLVFAQSDVFTLTYF